MACTLYDKHSLSFISLQALDLNHSRLDRIENLDRLVNLEVSGKRSALT
jgi:hypothetical protein